MMKMGVIDFGIGPDEEDLEGLESYVIHEGVFGLYVSSTIKKKEISNLGFILAEGECKDTVFFREAYYKKFAEAPKSTLKVSSWEIIANLTLEGLGIGYFPDYIASRNKEKLRQYDLGIAEFPYRICAFFPKGMKIRKSSEIFLSHFKKT